MAPGAWSTGRRQAVSRGNSCGWVGLHDLFQFVTDELAGMTGLAKAGPQIVEVIPQLLGQPPRQCLVRGEQTGITFTSVAVGRAAEVGVRDGDRVAQAFEVSRE